MANDPLPISLTPPNAKPRTWPDVAMRIVHDGPSYAIIALVGVLAIKGQAESLHVVLAGFGALLARNMPPAIRGAGAAVAVLVLAGKLVVACASTPVAPVAQSAVDVAGYELALDACLDKGKDAGSRAVYEACARAADQKYGRDGGGAP